MLFLCVVRLFSLRIFCVLLCLDKGGGGDELNEGGVRLYFGYLLCGQVVVCKVCGFGALGLSV